jgi:hypothetical protein
MSFTDVYRQAKAVIEAQSFAEPEWKKFLEDECGLKSIFGADGFDVATAPRLDLVRKKIQESAKHSNSLMIALFGGGPGEVIYKAAQNPKSPGKWQERAAVLEMIRCLYRAEDAGGAGVWVYSPPTAHSKPVFEELNTSDAAAKKKLGSPKEIFSPEERKLMVDALSVSRKVAGDTQFKLGANSKEARRLIRRWFTGASASSAEVDQARSTLLAGFNKIAVSCSATTLVFTDYLDWRAQRDTYFGAAFRGGEGGGFPVIYLEGAFTRLKGNSGKLWLAAETIIHELSHHDVNTEDHRYDHAGLAPGGNSFPAARAIENADSWGYFAIDLAGYLSDADRNLVLR